MRSRRLGHLSTTAMNMCCSTSLLPLHCSEPAATASQQSDYSSASSDSSSIPNSPWPSMSTAISMARSLSGGPTCAPSRGRTLSYPLL